MRMKKNDMDKEVYVDTDTDVDIDSDTDVGVDIDIGIDVDRDGETDVSIDMDTDADIGDGYQLQYSCLDNSMGPRAWWATIHRVAKSWTWLSDLSTDVVVDVEIEANLDHTWHAPPRAGAHWELVT